MKKIILMACFFIVENIFSSESGQTETIVRKIETDYLISYLLIEENKTVDVWKNKQTGELHCIISSIYCKRCDELPNSEFSEAMFNLADSLYFKQQEKPTSDSNSQNKSLDDKTDKSKKSEEKENNQKS